MQYLVIPIILIFYYLFKPMKFAPINKNNDLRNCDALGCGHFGASRTHGTHKGLDFKFTEFENVLAPFDCKIVRYGYPYANDLQYKLVEVQGIGKYKDYKAKLMYIKPIYDIGQIVLKTDTICYADDISKKHGSSMINHVHFELYKNNKLINPETFF